MDIKIERARASERASEREREREREREGGGYMSRKPGRQTHVEILYLEDVGCVRADACS